MRVSQRTTFIIIGLVIAVLVSGVISIGFAMQNPASGGTSSGSGLEGTNWELVSIDGAAAVSGGQPAGIEFKDGQIGGSTGCNRYFGGYTIEGDRLSFSRIGMTKMACTPELNAQEIAFVSALEKAEGYSIDGERLTISFDGGKQLVFIAG